MSAFDLVRKRIGNKRGSQMVEAAIAYPVIILAAVLMIRMLTFYLEILDTGICEHRKALESLDNYSGSGLKTYSSTENVYMFKGGLLKFGVSKRIDTRLYMLNEDLAVRAKEVVD